MVDCCCSLYDSDVSAWYSPSYSPPDHAYTPTGDLPDDDGGYPSDYDYSLDGYDDVDPEDRWRYDNRPRGTGRKLPAPPPTGDFRWQQQTPTPTVNGDYAPPQSVGDGGFANMQSPSRIVDSTTQPVDGYADDRQPQSQQQQQHDYAAYNGYYDDDYYYDGCSDGYDRSSEMYDDRYLTSFDCEYGDSLVNGYVDEYVHGTEMDRAYYDYADTPYDTSYRQPSPYDAAQRGSLHPPRMLCFHLCVSVYVCVRLAVCLSAG